MGEASTRPHVAASLFGGRHGNSRRRLPMGDGFPRSRPCSGREIGAGNSATKTDPPDRLPLMDQLATLAAGLEAGQSFNWPLPEHAGDRDRLMAITLVLEHHEGLASDEIQSHLAAGHARARELLLEHRERVIRVAEHLRDVRQVDAVEFLGLMSA